MSMFKSFQTDPDHESAGVWIEYETFRVRVARSGGKNTKYNKLLNKRMKPYRRALATDSMSDKVALDILREVFAEANVTEWQSMVGDQWMDGLETPETPEDPADRTADDLLPVTFDNVLHTLVTLPDLFSDLRSQSERVALYRKDIQTAEAGN